MSVGLIRAVVFQLQKKKMSAALWIKISSVGQPELLATTYKTIVLSRSIGNNCVQVNAGGQLPLRTRSRTAEVKISRCSHCGGERVRDAWFLNRK